jgi:hypothetical protein
MNSYKMERKRRTESVIANATEVGEDEDNV